MMNYPLLLTGILKRAATFFSGKKVITRVGDSVESITFKEMAARVGRLAAALKSLGVAKGDRVGTFAWNHQRHVELYYAIPQVGGILHTINIRLFPEQLEYVINHAEDKVLFVDADLLPLLEPHWQRLKTVETVVVMYGDGTETAGNFKVYQYEELLAAQPEGANYQEELDENDPAAMCYTTATTGNPKGVVYTHRALYLHSLVETMADTFAISERDNILPVVPQFHVNAWGLPFTALMVGANLIMPGSRPDPAALARLISDHKVTLAAGVPTVWLGVLQEAKKGNYDFSSLKRIIIGGSAVPPALMKAYEKELGVPVIHAYGMTETSPLVLACIPRQEMESWPEEELFRLRLKQGTLVPGLEMKAVDQQGREIPWDGQTMGELWLRGPWVTDGYYKDPQWTAEAIREGGWFRTMDIVTIDQYGYVEICDRTRDIIKSGGEWISSITLENLLMGHPAVLEAAVIAMPDPKWQERPLACVVLKPEYAGKVSAEELVQYLGDKVSKWWLPDEIRFVENIPKTSVGKFDKKVLRSQLLA